MCYIACAASHLAVLSLMTYCIYSLVFTIETKLGLKKIKDLRWRLGLKNCTTHLGKGKSAGIALFWDEHVEIKVMSKSFRYFDVLENDIPNGRKWRGNFVYGEPKSLERHHLWTALRRIKSNSEEPWLMAGDFNETKWQREHSSEMKRSERRMADFRNLLNFCELNDLDFSG
jgi:hypothetical protein